MSRIEKDARQSYDVQSVRKASYNKLLVSHQDKIIDADAIQARAVEQQYHTFPGVIIAS